MKLQGVVALGCSLLLGTTVYAQQQDTSCPIVKSAADLRTPTADQAEGYASSNQEYMVEIDFVAPTDSPYHSQATASVTGMKGCADLPISFTDCNACITSSSSASLLETSHDLCKFATVKVPTKCISLVGKEPMIHSSNGVTFYNIPLVYTAKDPTSNQPSTISRSVNLQVKGTFANGERRSTASTGNRLSVSKKVLVNETNSNQILQATYAFSSAQFDGNTNTWVVLVSAFLSGVNSANHFITGMSYLYGVTGGSTPTGWNVATSGAVVYAASQQAITTLSLSSTGASAIQSGVTACQISRLCRFFFGGGIPADKRLLTIIDSFLLL
jgi:hypothetical protein